MKQPIYLKYIKPKYPPESAGAKMVKNLPIFQPEDKVSQIKETLFRKATDFETLNYIYVVNKEKKLLGVFSIKEIFQKPEETKIEEIMEKKIIKAHPYTDQERIAILALKNNLKAVPIVDKEDHFLGAVTSDTILEILHNENVEDFLKFAGIKTENYLYLPAKIFDTSTIKLAKIRLPWLIFGLIGGVLAAQVVNLFEGSLKVHFILAAFTPLMVYMADAVGVQTQTLFIRNITVVDKLNIKNYLIKELKTSFLIALLLGFILSIISFFWSGLPYIGLILGLSLFLTIVSASLIAIFIPWVLNKSKKDPAVGSGPFATIVRDILSLIIYFSVASLILKFYS